MPLVVPSSGVTTAIPTIMVAPNLTAGEETVPRDVCTSTTASSGSGALRLTYFRPSKSFTTTQARAYVGSPAAAATPTLCKYGLYRIDSTTGDGTLIAATANDTSMFANVLGGYTRSWITPVDIVGGNIYAFGVLVVSTQATPSFASSLVNSALLTEFSATTRLTALLVGQTDLATSFTAGSVTNSSSRIYGVILP